MYIVRAAGFNHFIYILIWWHITIGNVCAYGHAHAHDHGQTINACSLGCKFKSLNQIK